MPTRLFSAREMALWAAAFAVIATIIVATRFSSDDPDSALYADISGRLAQEPVARWIAPEWWGFWPDAHMSGYFREHPAGVFLLPAALARVGIPAAQGAYIVGTLSGLAAVLMMAWLIGQVSTRDEARGALVLLQLMPVAFIFRMRANHEYPMLVCLLLALIGLARVAEGRPLWRGVALVGVGLTAGLFIKGVFAIKILLALGLWVMVNPTGHHGTRLKQATVVAIGIVVMLIGAMAYDFAYRAMTTEGFWGPYWQRQIGPLAAVTPWEVTVAILRNILFYLSRLLWHPAPWSFALVMAGWKMRGRFRTAWAAMPQPSRRGVVFALAFAALAVLVLSPASRYAERYAFSATHAVACAGVVAAYRTWPKLAASLRRADAAVVGFPALVWFTLALLRLGAGPLLPRL